MKIGVVRNIAGNIEALKDADRQFTAFGVDARVCLGQIVGVYPFVDACVEYLINREYLALRRHEEDEFVSGCKFHGWSTTHLVDALRFARSRVSKQALEYLEALPLRCEIHGVAFESRANVKDGMLYDPDQVKSALDLWPHPIVFHAAHFDPYVWRDDLTGTSLKIGQNELESGHRLLISTGGVGSRYQGSVDTRKPIAMVFDDEQMTVHLLQPMCDIQTIFSRLRQSEYPRHVLKALEGFEYEVWRTAEPS